MPETALEAVEGLVRARLTAADGMLVLGLCGAQGSGKSTLAGQLAARLGESGVAAAVLGIDDLYLGKAARARLAAAVHPLLATRGVPGTHDVDLGLEAIARLEHGLGARLPRFDKARDDRCAEDAWESVPAGCAVLILEGWCVGARPQAAGALAAPVNALEAVEDADGRWRRWVNAALAGDYQRLFTRIDALVLLAAPGFEVVRGWRTEQERALRAAGPGGMSDGAIAAFVQHYQRLTGHVLSEMPGRADLTIRLDAKRRVIGIDRPDGGR